MKKGPLLKLGALEFQLGRKVDVPQYYDFEFRLPPTWQERVMPRDVSTTLRIRVAIAIDIHQARARALHGNAGNAVTIDVHHVVASIRHGGGGACARASDARARFAAETRSARCKENNKIFGHNF